MNRIPLLLMASWVLAACGDDGASAGVPGFADCQAPPRGPQEPNLAFRVGTRAVACADLDGSLQIATNGSYGFVGLPTNDSEDKAQIVANNSMGDLRAGYEHVATRDAQGLILNPPMSVFYSGSYCPVAGTLTVEEYERDEQTGRIAGTVVGDVDTTCTEAKPPGYEYTSVRARFESDFIVVRQ